ncbi:hypothetical protein ACFWI5_04980 [Streptomyces sp. NPDC127064]|uniref:hypothetical protein n=1 Tax=Streptomyces sp. NPDC127064 TaxID=3347124 RepID=UPI00364F8CD7
MNIDPTCCRAHQHAAGAPRKPPDCILNGTLTVTAVVIRLRDTVPEPSETA